MSGPGAIYPFHQIISYNPPIDEAASVALPTISSSAVIGTHSMIIGNVTLDADVFIGFHNIIRADSSYPFFIGKKSNIQDFVLLHCHPSQYVKVNGDRMGIYIEGNVSMLHHSAVHGPLFIGENTFIGQHVSIYGAIIGKNCVVMHGAVIAEHVKIPDGRLVEPNQTVVSQDVADTLPVVPQRFSGLNQHIVDFYYRLGKSYLKNTPLAFSVRDSSYKRP